MHPTSLLLRYGEIFLKGKNRVYFERKLINNIHQITGLKPRAAQARLFMEYYQNHALLKRVFGLVSYSPVVEVAKDVEKISPAVLNWVLVKQLTEFRIEATRSDKQFPLTSPQLKQVVGKYVEQHSSARYSKTTPNCIMMEVGHAHVFLFCERIPCCGGLPTGIEGKALVVVENQASLLAGILMMKRGVSIYPVAFEQKDISLLQRYSPEKLQLKIIEESRGIAEYARERKIDVVVVGDALNHEPTLDPKQKDISSLITLRPLVSYVPQKIEQELAEFSR